MQERLRQRREVKARLVRQEKRRKLRKQAAERKVVLVCRSLPLHDLPLLFNKFLCKQLSAAIC